MKKLAAIGEIIMQIYLILLKWNKKIAATLVNLQHRRKDWKRNLCRSISDTGLTNNP